MLRTHFTMFLAVFTLCLSGLALVAPDAHAVPYGAPCTVQSYSLHARYQMAMRDISTWDVENSVQRSCAQNNVLDQGDGTFKYLSSYVKVVLNRDGRVVTTWINYGSGGGGGSWRAIPNDQVSTLPQTTITVESSRNDSLISSSVPIVGVTYR
ncbi:MAG: hypothetical protein LBV06_07270 [Propionibacteriaceae bacterium]|jgi:hypothetical protein|nr:hypothetical protein [Propionibacteriaceae bacterium]